MKNLDFFSRKLEHLYTITHSNMLPAIRDVSMSLYQVIAFSVNPFYIQLFYCIFMSLLGYLLLKVSMPRTQVRPKDLDLFFTSVSASTVSSMTVIEKEVFSNSQLILISFLMLAGGEVFISLLGLEFSKFNLTQEHCAKNKASTLQIPDQALPNANESIELAIVSLPHPLHQKQSDSDFGSDGITVSSDDKLKYNSTKFLGYTVLGYLMVVHLFGSSLVSLYISLIPSAREVLRSKGLNLLTFSFFTVISSFSNCGFLPTNENMIVFKKNSGLLLLIIPLIYLGNTLYPPCLRVLIWFLKKITRREELSYILRNYREMGFDHLLSDLHCWLLVGTVVGFTLTQFAMFCFMEWNSENMDGLDFYQKLVCSLFQVVNARHAGESVFHLNSISAAILVLFMVMMYLPPYTKFLPARDQENDTNKGKRSLVECLLFSQLSYLVIFIIVICITESKSLREDPLNFNVFNITLEVIRHVSLSLSHQTDYKLHFIKTKKDLMNLLNEHS
ncbi:hypothetical protein L6164_007399 [Bauhinia variegata]|uniref:Uncharacterized protein n=1 Tax=Bauhinia variegata TaxID=167791 RepID=A0ACB9PEV5_BAUVA|nr:hypothetical protein L6164_007399 [Bauhinia variegata]